VGSNLFGDILSDVAAAVCGSMGVAPSANLDPTGENPSMCEPVHGSAPDIAGRGVANPIAQIWCGAMMLEHLGHPEAAADVLTAIETVTADPALRTRDLGGRASTEDVTCAVLAALPVRSAAEPCVGVGGPAEGARADRDTTGPGGPAAHEGAAE
jgi:tartrate dehydrogenase/decarboxylase/D-malate dehydrogenase